MNKGQKIKESIRVTMGVRVSKEVLEYIDHVAKTENRSRSKVADLLLSFAVSIKKGESHD